MVGYLHDAVRRALETRIKGHESRSNFAKKLVAVGRDEGLEEVLDEPRGRSAMTSSLVPRWSVAAKIVRERPYGPGGVEKRSGAKHFRASAKVWVIDWFPGTCMDVVLVGHHRGSGRWAKITCGVKVLESFRPALVYSPTVIGILEEHFRGRAPVVASESEAREMCVALAAWIAES